MRISDWSSDVCSSDLKGVDTVAVSLTHEQALVEFDPQVVKPEVLLQVLRDIGYTIHDPNKLRPFEEEERELVREGRRFLVATAFSLLSVALISEPSGLLSALLPAVATVSLVAFVRSEEHTSELQSLMRISYAVFCLKKKKIKHQTQAHSNHSINITT